MKVLVIGSGGREHALAWKIAKSDKVTKLFIAPGNPGTAEVGTNVDIKAEDIEALKDFALKEKIDLTVVGPEVPLTMGIVDQLEAVGLKTFGPNQKAAILEGSKTFSKDLMAKYNIPTAAYGNFTSADEAKAFIDKGTFPVVVKASGLAAGKGVIIASNKDEAYGAVDSIMGDKAFGDAGSEIVVEEFLAGEEASFIAVTDGKTIVPMASSQDHKAVYDGDKGPNTGGMGAYSPAPVLTDELQARAMKEVMEPLVRGMEAEGRPFKGVVYAGLMIDGDKINVLEFNCRFGDPECQPIMMRLKDDVVDLMLASIDGTMDKLSPTWEDDAAVCVVMASGGYPGSYEKGFTITGIDDVKDKDITVFHAGTSMKDSKLVNTGGRVLGVTGRGATIKKAIDKAYEGVEKIKWQDAYYRKDIGKKALSK